MNPSDLSRRYAVRKLTEGDSPRLLPLCQGNPLFYQYCPPEPSPESLRADMAALPPRCTPEDKYYLGFFDGAELTAVLDLVLHFPNREAAFIGFFMVNAACQGKGLGTALVEEILSALALEGFREVRLGRVEGNPQSEAFWHKLGFREIGAKNREAGYTVLVMARPLSPGM